MGVAALGLIYRSQAHTLIQTCAQERESHTFPKAPPLLPDTIRATASGRLLPTYSICREPHLVVVGRTARGTEEARNVTVT